MLEENHYCGIFKSKMLPIMKKYMKLLLLMMVTLSFNSLLLSQCPGTPPLDFTFETTESRCESNGTITLHITGGTPFTDIFGNPIYNNTIIAPTVMPIGGQSDSVFTALEANTYTVEVKDANGCSVSHSVVVPGTHMQLELTPTWSDATCDGLGGGWICGTPDEGRPWPPGYYQYQLFDASTNPPTPLGPIGLDSCFTDLAAGAYQIRAYDSCSNFQTRDVILAANTYSNLFRMISVRINITCDSACIRMYTYQSSSDNVPWGEFPYQWEVISADTSLSELIGVTGQWDAHSEQDTVCFSPPYADGNFVLQVTDACGKMETRAVAVRPFAIAGFDGYDCVEGGFISVSPSYTYYCESGTISYEIISGPPGFPLPPPQDTGYWTNISTGIYGIQVTDCCGNVDTYSLSAAQPAWTARIDTFRIETCELGWVGFNASYNTGGGPTPSGLTTVVTNAPVGYPNPIPDTLNYYSIDIEGPPGNYCFTMYDQCNRRDSICYNVTDTLIFEPDITITSGCVSGNQLDISWTSNFDVQFDLYQLIPYQNIVRNSDSAVFTNLNTGTYVIFWENDDDGNCRFLIDTVIIPEYITPSITGAWGIECSNGAGLITVAGADGNTPYTYELYQGPVTRPLQSSPSFAGLPSGTYDIRLNDNCNNSATITVSIEPFMPIIQGYGGSFCAGEDATLYVDYFDLASYSWTGPNGNTSDTSILNISNLTLADAGTYIIDIDVVNPDQSACIAQQLTVDIEVLDCTNCQTAIDDNLDLCAIIDGDSTHPFATLDCDEGGVSNIDECTSGNDPLDPSDDCQAAFNNNLNICQLINLEIDHPLSNLDCDEGGVTNIQECQNGGDPADPADDCEIAADIGMDICAILDPLGSGTFDPSNPWATLDCDNGGVSNIDECIAGTDPNVPSDDPSCGCHDAQNGTINICAILTANPSSPLATLDCDNGGVDNLTECENNGDPLDPADDCNAAELAVLDICAMIAANPDHPLADLDCDDGGLLNSSECANGSDPFDSADDCATAITAEMDLCLIIAADPTHPLSELDCDNGGIDNYTECRNGGDPSEADDDCTTAVTAGSDLCIIIDNDPTHPWASLDCDLGGIDNMTECANGNDPTNPIDDESCPVDFCEEAIDNNTDICSLLTSDPTHPLGTLDCDEGGVDNATECAEGTDPANPADDCDAANIGGINICVIVTADPTHPLADVDCDGGGVSNLDECASGENPFDPADDCTAAIDEGLNICQLINYDPTHPLATLDCDNGGVSNMDECNSGGDPSDPTDDLQSICVSAMNGDLDICALLTADPTHPIGQADCDEGGVINAEECTNGNDPLDPLDDCPDITPITTILPGNIAGTSGVGVAVEITELNGINTDGSAILVRMPSDPRLTFLWDPNLTSVALTPVNNSNWNYLGNNGVVHTFQYVGNGIIINGGTTEAFGFESTYDPQSTDGQTTVTASIVPFGGGECNLLNDTDSERLVYFE